MNVLIYIHSLACGGAERFVVTLSNYWAQKGWTITIVTAESRELDFFALAPQVQRIELGLAGSSTGLFHGMVQNFRRVLALRRVIRKVRPTVALGVMSTANVVLALSLLGTGTRGVGSERVHPAQTPLSRPWEVLRKYLYGRLCAVVALTNETAAWLSRWTTARRVVVIPNAAVWPLEPQSPVLSPSALVRPGEQVILAVGRLTEQKGFDALIDAFSAVGGKSRPWRLVILGDGPARSTLEARVLAAGLTDRVSLPGRAGNMRDWYEAADLFVLSSRFEGFPNTLIEAMAHGLAVVSFDCDTGPRDIIKDGANGMLVPPGDIAALSGAMRLLMSEDHLRKTYSEQAIAIRGRLALSEIAQQWEDLFRSIGTRND
jgi:glycosyltransferase involved in cell wall biosynthesis